MGYRTSIVTLEFDISPYDMNPGWAGELSLNTQETPDIIITHCYKGKIILFCRVTFCSI